MEVEAISDVQRIHLGPHDVLLVKLDAKYPAEVLNALRVDLEERLPGNRVIVTCPDVELAVIDRTPHPEAGVEYR